MRARRTTSCAALAAAALLLLAPRPGAGGDWHAGGLLVCSDCHTTHNSRDGAPMRYDQAPGLSPGLLRAADEVSLCLACHDGSNPRAPDVLAPVGYVADAAAGFFSSRGGGSGDTGHDLLPGAPVQVPLGSQQLTLTCASCHDTHGNGSYRNLRARPGGGPGAPLAVVVDQAKRADGTNPAEVYATSNLRYRAGVSAWCLDCHDQAATGHAHSYDRPMFGSTVASYAAWLAVQGTRVPALNPTDPTIPSEDDQATCVSCHSAHGNANRAALREPNGPDTLCVQCHDQ